MFTQKFIKIFHSVQEVEPFSLFFRNWRSAKPRPMINVILQYLGLDLFNSKSSTKFYQNIPNGLRVFFFFFFFFFLLAPPPLSDTIFFRISCEIMYVLFTNLQSIIIKKEIMRVCMYVSMLHTHTHAHTHTHTWRELRLYRALIHAWALIYTYMTLHQDYIEHWFTHTYMPADWVYIEYDTYIHDGRLRLYRALIHTYMMVNWDYIDTYMTVNWDYIEHWCLHTWW